MSDFKDWHGQALALGNLVVFLSHSRTSSSFIYGRVRGFSKCKVRLEVLNLDGTSRHEYRDAWYPDLRLTWPDKIIKVTGRVLDR